jgi:exoribonuclease II
MMKSWTTLLLVVNRPRSAQEKTSRIKNNSRAKCFVFYLPLFPVCSAVPLVNVSHTTCNTMYVCMYVRFLLHCIVHLTCTHNVRMYCTVLWLQFLHVFCSTAYVCLSYSTLFITIMRL